MTQPCMRAYTQLVIKTCHKRGVHAMGGMAAQIPIKNDPEANKVWLPAANRTHYPGLLLQNEYVHRQTQCLGCKGKGCIEH